MFNLAKQLGCSVFRRRENSKGAMQLPQFFWGSFAGLGDGVDQRYYQLRVADGY